MSWLRRQLWRARGRRVQPRAAEWYVRCRTGITARTYSLKEQQLAV